MHTFSELVGTPAGDQAVASCQSPLRGAAQVFVQLAAEAGAAARPPVTTGTEPATRSTGTSARQRRLTQEPSIFAPSPEPSSAYLDRLSATVVTAARVGQLRRGAQTPRAAGPREGLFVRVPETLVHAALNSR